MSARPRPASACASSRFPPELSAILADRRQALIAYAVSDELTQRQRDGARKGIEAGWVFPNAKGAPTASQVVRKPLLKVLAALDEAEKSGIDYLTVHGLRRTMNNLLRQVTHGEVVRPVTSHVTERMTLHYSHVAHAAEAQAVAQVVSLVRARPTEVGLSVGPWSGQKRTAGEASL